MLSGRLTRWHLLLDEFNISYVTQTLIKGKVIADYLAKNPIPWISAHDRPNPDESILNIETEKDTLIGACTLIGAVNVHGNQIGANLISAVGAHFPVAIELKFSYTNNMAEYEACTRGRPRYECQGSKTL